MMRSEQAFTLIELLVAIAVVTILMTVAVPGYISLQQYFAAEGSARQLTSAITAARAGAVNSARPVVLCRLINNEEDRCAGNKVNSQGDWSNGWMLFMDRNSDQLFNSGDQLLKVVQNPGAGCTVRGRGDFLSFQPDGLLRGGGNGTFRLECGSQQRKLTINILGRVRLTKLGNL